MRVIHKPNQATDDNMGILCDSFSSCMHEDVYKRIALLIVSQKIVQSQVRLNN